MTTRIVDRSAVGAVIDRTKELCQIPAPSGEEERRARLVAEWWRSDGWDQVRIDEVGNVWARARASGGSALMMAAHLDTVFGPEVPHHVVERDDRLLGPGVADNTVAVAALSTVAALFPPEPGAEVWMVGTVGEEGLGDLRGMRHALAQPPRPVDAVIAVEGNYLGRVVHRGVGSVRLRVELSGPGGHAWEKATAPSAVHEAATMISGLLSLPAVQDSGCSLNVGRIAGGEGINARARKAWFELDLRSDDPGALHRLEDSLRARLRPSVPSLEISVTEIGRRPAGGLPSTHPLVTCSLRALLDAGIEPRLCAASTDANAAYAVGVPAVTLGVSTGGGEHTPGEWLDLAPIGQGLEVLADTVSSYLTMDGEGRR